MNLMSVLGGLGLFSTGADPVTLPWWIILSYFANAFLLGSLLMTTTLIFIQYTRQLSGGVANGGTEEKDESIVQTMIGAANLLFLCVGLTGVMILVANNLTRALAISAILAITRFRVKLGTKNLVANLLFAVIVGVACGLGEFVVAYWATAIYIILKAMLLVVLSWAARRAVASRGKNHVDEKV